MKDKLLVEIDRVVWDEGPTAEEKLASLQRLMYQWGACQDSMTEQMFGDDDAHINSPNMRRI
jgi:hypothetical protein